MNSGVTATQPELFANNGQPLWLDRLRKGIWPKPLVFWIAAIYMALFIIRPWERLFPTLADLRFERIMVLFVVGAVLLMRGPFIKVTLQNVAMLLLYAAVWLSGRYAFDPVASEIQVTEFLGLLISYFVIQKVVKSPYQMLFIMACYLTATAAYVFKSEWEYLLHDGGVSMMGVTRLQGINYTYGHPNNMGVSLVCSLPFALYFYRIRWQFCQTWPRLLRKLFVWALPLYGIAAVLGILLTRSRASAVGLLLFLVLLVFQKKGFATKVKWGLAFLTICIVGFFCAPDDIRYRIQSTWDASVEYKANMGGANQSAVGRIEGLFAGLEIFRRFPVTGVGIGNFALYRELYVDKIGLDAHNIPGEVLGELGLVGAVAFGLFFLAMCLNTRKLLQYGSEYQQLTGNDIYRLLGVALFDAVVLLVYAGISCHTLQYYQWYWFAAFLMLAVTFVKSEVQRADELALCDEATQYASEDDLAVDDIDSKWSVHA